jgi:hypothetical protein
MRGAGPPFGLGIDKPTVAHTVPKPSSIALPFAL